MSEDLRFLRLIEETLLRAEAQISLLAALAPTNLTAERQRLLCALDGARPDPRQLVPRFIRRQFQGQQVASALLVAGRGALAACPEGGRAELLRERIDELEQELAIVAACSAAEVRVLARRRYAMAKAEAPAAQLAEDWLLPDVGTSAGTPAESEVDLASALTHWCRQEGLDIPVRLADLSTRAAVSTDAVLVSRGARATRREAQRVFVHEVHGHLLPRRRALSAQLPPGRVGSTHADMDEEGRALHLEESFGLLSARRRQELACRHLLAEAVHQANDAAEVGELALTLRARGLGQEVIVNSLCRAFRGGGLGREVIYLRGLVRIREASTDAALMLQLEQGRYSVDAARRLLGLPFLQ